MNDMKLALAWKTQQGYTDCSTSLEEHDKQIREEVKAEYESADIPIIHGKEELAEHDSKLLDKVAEKIREYGGMHYVDCDGYFGGIAELIFKVDDWLDDIIAEMKAEVEK